MLVMNLEKAVQVAAAMQADEDDGWEYRVRQIGDSGAVVEVLDGEGRKVGEI